MTPEQVAAHFTRADGTYQFARWGRPIVPLVFGVEAATLSVVKGAIEAIVTLAGHQMAETDPELGANLMVFFLRDWQELHDAPNLERLIPDLPQLVVRLQEAQANQYRSFRFDPDGAIQACFVFLRMDTALSQMPVETLALGQMVQTILLWSENAFAETSPLAVVGERRATILRPEIGDLIRAAYAPVLPSASADPSHGLRLVARMHPA